MILRQGILFFVFAINIAIYSHETGYAWESSADPNKLVIIELIEDRLAGACTIRSVKESPDFGTLDQIYPQWHKGEPAKARRRWTFHGYQTYAISYIVYSVYMDQPGMATAKGKRKVSLSRRVKFLKYFHEVKRETSETQFIIICRRNLSGAWEITKETISSLQYSSVPERSGSPALTETGPNSKKIPNHLKKNIGQELLQRQIKER